LGGTLHGQGAADGNDFAFVLDTETDKRYACDQDVLPGGDIK
jgi:hypothetical protein